MITDKTARTNSCKALETASSLKSQAGNVVSTAARPPAGLEVQRQPCPQGASLGAGPAGEREAGPGGRAGRGRPCCGPCSGGRFLQRSAAAHPGCSSDFSSALLSSV